mmetsp:Transcript_7249/g.16003  ORF Transcript_7249/g.16003 Transcript_7249/m.16003 type:complete len:216 (+) Transcript_7249:544-1191(+)
MNQVRRPRLVLEYFGQETSSNITNWIPRQTESLQSTVGGKECREKRLCTFFGQLVVSQVQLHNLTIGHCSRNGQTSIVAQFVLTKIQNVQRGALTNKLSKRFNVRSFQTQSTQRHEIYTAATSQFRQASTCPRILGKLVGANLDIQELGTGAQCFPERIHILVVLIHQEAKIREAKVHQTGVGGQSLARRGFRQRYHTQSNSRELGCIFHGRTQR